MFLIYKKFKFIFYNTNHTFHLVDPSPWPILGSIGALSLTTGSVLYMHSFTKGWSLLVTGFILINFTVFVWFRDIIREATFEDCHHIIVQKGLKLGMLLFIISEIMFFFAFFWGFFHSSLAPVFNIGAVWPPKAITLINTYTIPLTNTFFLLSSGLTVTWAHHAVIIKAKKHAIIALLLTLVLAFLFSLLQSFEYLNVPFSISDSIYGSCFFLLTGFHGFHVLIGTIALLVSLVRIVLNHYTNKHHFGFEAAIWYWHMVGATARLLFLIAFTRV